MTLRQYHNVYDKTEWGPGAWQHEPDKVQWVDDVTDLDCLIVRTPLGHLCGYVGVPPEHPWHGFGYGQCIDSDADHDEDDWHYECTLEGRLDAHGGITYAAACQEISPEESGICHVAEPGRPDDVWWFGFDHAHLGDTSPGMPSGFGREASYKTVGYVRDGCTDLARQLAEAAR